MSAMAVLVVVLAAYFGLNFLCALLLHLHARRQAHLPLRFGDVAMHFVLLTLFALPALVYVTASAMFGSEQTSVSQASTPTMRAAA